MPNPPASVRKRLVFYIPGYDPHPPRRYRELYRTEGRKQAGMSGYRLAVRKKEGPRYGWQVATDMDGSRVRTDVEVLEWSDIVRNTMDHTVGGTYLQLVRTAWTYIGSGTLRRLAWLRKGPVLAGLYPVAMLLGQLAVAVFAAWLAASAVLTVISYATQGLAWVLGATWNTNGLVWSLSRGLIGWAVGLSVILPILRFFRGIDGRVFAYYLMHDLAYTAKDGGAYPAELDARIKEFTEVVARAMAGDADEVLIIGHSSGAHLAVTVVSDLVRTGRLPASGPDLSLLTLGQAIPMVSFLPKADRLRRDLNRLSHEDRITWVDVSAPADGCSFALCDPVSVTGVAPQRGLRWPLVLSAAFSKTLSDKKQKHLRWRFFSRHFQYLCAFDKSEGYDYFRITAGPITLRERFAERKPSMNRIDVPASRYTSMAA